MRDVERCTASDRDRVGLHFEEGDANETFFTIGPAGGRALALLSMARACELRSPEPVRPEEEAVHRTYCAVFVDDVDREYEELRKKGVRFVKPPATGSDGWRDSFFEDPDGNLWEVSQAPKG